MKIGGWQNARATVARASCPEPDAAILLSTVTPPLTRGQVL